MKRLIDRLPAIRGVKTERLALEEPFPDMADRFAREPNTVVLLSGGDLDCARHHILAIRPWLVFSGRLGRSSVLVDDTPVHVAAQPPLDLLRSILNHCRLQAADTASIIEAGLFGYLAYDLKDHLETLPRTTIDDTGLPHLWFIAPSLIVVQDRTTRETRIHAPIRSDRGVADAGAAIDRFRVALETPLWTPGGAVGAESRLDSNFSRTDYEEAVRRIKDYIAAGDVYQVNLSQRFSVDYTGDGYSLYKTLYSLNPAPFFAYIDAGDHRIVSTSPERFLLRGGRRVEARPIKGTRPRGKTDEEDRQMRAALVDSPKDDAELSMIVDLLRNDLGKVCSGGSVVVSRHKRLEAYRNVYHLVSVVEGVLAGDKDAVDLIRATFPGGSITGCPKIRAMEIIDELEACRRHVYTGSIGYISFHDTMDLSIAIRTATLDGGRLSFSVGGGIVFDSDPREEYEETLHKGRTVMSVVRGTAAAPAAGAGPPSWVWLNGRLV
ncbi:MAG TPA: aminodeoxychorismate synthase component I, partial [Desulfosarcina sp.]|nr:aminodeoxychorismate synthase component I [Desulfosarcina sp.]